MSIVASPSKEVWELLKALGIGPHCKEFKISFVLGRPVTITSTHYGTQEHMVTLTDFVRKFVIDTKSTYDVDRVLRRKE